MLNYLIAIVRFGGVGGDDDDGGTAATACGYRASCTACVSIKGSADENAAAVVVVVDIAQSRQVFRRNSVDVINLHIHIHANVRTDTHTHADGYTALVLVLSYTHTLTCGYNVDLLHAVLN